MSNISRKHVDLLCIFGGHLFLRTRTTNCAGVCEQARKPESQRFDHQRRLDRCNCGSLESIACQTLYSQPFAA